MQCRMDVDTDGTYTCVLNRSVFPPGWQTQTMGLLAATQQVLVCDILLYKRRESYLLANDFVCSLSVLIYSKTKDALLVVKQFRLRKYSMCAYN